LFKLWPTSNSRSVAYHLWSPKPGSELADFQNLTHYCRRVRRSDACNFNSTVPCDIRVLADWTRWRHHADCKAKLADLLRLGGPQKAPYPAALEPCRTVHDLLDVVEDINKDYPVRELRWVVAAMSLQRLFRDNLKRNEGAGPDLGACRDGFISAASVAARVGGSSRAI